MSMTTLPAPVLPAASTARTTMLCSPGAWRGNERSYFSVGESFSPSAGWAATQSPASTEYAVSRTMLKESEAVKVSRTDDPAIFALSSSMRGGVLSTSNGSESLSGGTAGARRRARDFLERDARGLDFHLAELRGQVRLQVGDGHLAQGWRAGGLARLHVRAPLQEARRRTVEQRTARRERSAPPVGPGTIGLLRVPAAHAQGDRRLLRGLRPPRRPIPAGAPATAIPPG